MTRQVDGRVVEVWSDPGGTAGGIQGMIFDPRTTSH